MRAKTPTKPYINIRGGIVCIVDLGGYVIKSFKILDEPPLVQRINDYCKAHSLSVQSYEVLAGYERYTW